MVPIESINPPADEQDIQALEERFHFRMPQELREFFLQHNGASFPPDARVEPERSALCYFHTIGREYLPYVLTIDKLMEWQEMDQFIPMYYVPFCSDTADDSYYVRVDEEGYGKIYYIFSEFLDDFLADPEKEGFIANSFSEFLEMIQQIELQ